MSIITNYRSHSLSSTFSRSCATSERRSLRIRRTAFDYRRRCPLQFLRTLPRDDGTRQKPLSGSSPSPSRRYRRRRGEAIAYSRRTASFTAAVVVDFPTAFGVCFPLPNRSFRIVYTYRRAHDTNRVVGNVLLYEHRNHNTI